MVSDYCATIAKRAQILSWIKAETGGMAEGPDTLPINLCAMRLGAVLKKLDSLLLTILSDPSNFRSREAIEVRNNHSFHPGIYRANNLVKCRISSSQINIKKEWLRSDGEQRSRCIHASIGYSSNTIARTHTQCPQGKFNCVRTVSKPDAVISAQIFGE